MRRKLYGLSLSELPVTQWLEKDILKYIPQWILAWSIEDLSLGINTKDMIRDGFPSRQENAILSLRLVNHSAAFVYFACLQN